MRILLCLFLLCGSAYAGMVVNSSSEGTTVTVDGKVIASPQTGGVDMTTILHDDTGKLIDDQFTKPEGDKDCAHCKPLTLGNAVAHALFFVAADERDVTPEQKWAWAVFADKIRNEKHAALTAAEADLIVKRLGKMYGGIVLMRAIPLIDPNRKPPEIK